MANARVPTEDVARRPGAATDSVYQWIPAPQTGWLWKFKISGVDESAHRAVGATTNGDEESEDGR